MTAPVTDHSTSPLDLHLALSHLHTSRSTNLRHDPDARLQFYRDCAIHAAACRLRRNVPRAEHADAVGGGGGGATATCCYSIWQQVLLDGVCDVWSRVREECVRALVEHTDSPSNPVHLLRRIVRLWACRPAWYSRDGLMQLLIALASRSGMTRDGCAAQATRQTRQTPPMDSHDRDGRGCDSDADGGNIGCAPNRMGSAVQQPTLHVWPMSVCSLILRRIVLPAAAAVTAPLRTRAVTLCRVLVTAHPMMRDFVMDRMLERVCTNTTCGCRNTTESTSDESVALAAMEGAVETMAALLPLPGVRTGGVAEHADDTRGDGAGEWRRAAAAAAARRQHARIRRVVLRHLAGHGAATVRHGAAALLGSAAIPATRAVADLLSALPDNLSERIRHPYAIDAEAPNHSTRDGETNSRAIESHATHHSIHHSRTYRHRPDTSATCLAVMDGDGCTRTTRPRAAAPTPLHPDVTDEEGLCRRAETTLLALQHRLEAVLRLPDTPWHTPPPPPPRRCVRHGCRALLSLPPNRFELRRLAAQVMPLLTQYAVRSATTAALAGLAHMYLDLARAAKRRTLLQRRPTRCRHDGGGGGGGGGEGGNGRVACGGPVRRPTCSPPPHGRVATTGVLVEEMLAQWWWYAALRAVIVGDGVDGAAVEAHTQWALHRWDSLLDDADAAVGAASASCVAALLLLLATYHCPPRRLGGRLADSAAAADHPHRARWLTRLHDTMRCPRVWQALLSHPRGRRWLGVGIDWVGQCGGSTAMAQAVQEHLIPVWTAAAASASAMTHEQCILVTMTTAAAAAGGGARGWLGCGYLGGCRRHDGGVWRGGGRVDDTAGWGGGHGLCGFLLRHDWRAPRVRQDGGEAVGEGEVWLRGHLVDHGGACARAPTATTMGHDDGGAGYDRRRDEEESYSLAGREAVERDLCGTLYGACDTEMATVRAIREMMRVLVRGGRMGRGRVVRWVVRRLDGVAPGWWDTAPCPEQAKEVVKETGTAGWDDESEEGGGGEGEGCCGIVVAEELAQARQLVRDVMAGVEGDEVYDKKLLALMTRR